ncbi:unnamed protein product [Pieris macdunnoughi]|uniref:Uncharacterized protein n=1 Tax=Pieris macdunnoughi TaxID=345717 RepID=A0A821WGA1_9NEOP|nr:unnamed protein product [Pieris macdunnoughi]
MKTKKCTIEPTPEPPPPDPCKLQRIRQKEKAGIKICPPKPIEPPEPIAPCLAICIEKIKNPPYTTTEEAIVCIVDREKTGTSRCDAIEDLTAAHSDPPHPCMKQPPPPQPPPPPPPDPCEVQKKRERLAACKEKYKRYYE